MKRLLLGILGILMLVMSGCGDASISVVIPVDQPSITLNQVTKDPVDRFIDGSVVFYAPDSDVDTMTIVVFDSRGHQMARTTTPLNYPGVVNGTIFFSIDYATYPPDMYTFTIYLTDFRGVTSNQAVGSFSVP